MRALLDARSSGFVSAAVGGAGNSREKRAPSMGSDAGRAVHGVIGSLRKVSTRRSARQPRPTIPYRRRAGQRGLLDNPSRARRRREVGVRVRTILRLSSLPPWTVIEDRALPGIGRTAAVASCWSPGSLLLSRVELREVGLDRRRCDHGGLPTGCCHRSSDGLNVLRCCLDYCEPRACLASAP